MDFQRRARSLFFILLFLLPFQTVYFLREAFVAGTKWQYGTIGIYASDVVLLMAFVAAFIGWIRNGLRTNNDLGFRNYEKETRNSRAFIPKASILSHKSLTLLAMFALWAGLSLLWSPDRMLAGYFSVEMLLATGVFLIARSLDEEGQRFALNVLIVAGVVQALIGIGQFVSQESFASSLLGMSAHPAWEAGSSVLKLDSGRFLRAYGTFPHPNILGGFLGVILVLAVGRFSFLPSFQNLSPTPPLKKGGDLRHWMIIVSCISIILFGLILTFSRTAWLGTVMGILALATLFFFQLKSKSDIIRLASPARRAAVGDYVAFFKTLGVLGIAGMVFIGVLHEQIFPRFDSATIDREGSVEDRIASLRDAEVLIREHPLLGVGAGNFTAAIIERGIKGETGNQAPRPVWSVQPAHNVFVLIFAELGMIGLVLSVAFFASIFVKIKKSNSNIIRRPSDYITVLNERDVVFMAGFVALLPALLLDHYLWTSHFGLLFFFLLAGLSSRKS